MDEAFMKSEAKLGISRPRSGAATKVDRKHAKPRSRSLYQAYRRSVSEVLAHGDPARLGRRAGDGVESIPG
jgi:hypothetical protein